jgi:dTDP-4-dehydrorhamnose 3,5-epimerase
MHVTSTELPELVVIEPRIFGDSRGYFMESWNQARYRAFGLPDMFLQDNLSASARGVLRGLHFQQPSAQGKLVTVIVGQIFDVAVDIRVGSPRFGKAATMTLSGENKRQVYIPPGFAHGFCVLSESALFMYKCTELYDPEVEGGIIWNDPDLAIPWPIQTPTLSNKDAGFQRLRDVDPSRLPVYREGPADSQGARR